VGWKLRRSEASVIEIETRRVKEGRKGRKRRYPPSRLPHVKARIPSGWVHNIHKFMLRSRQPLHYACAECTIQLMLHNVLCPPFAYGIPCKPKWQYCCQPCPVACHSYSAITTDVPCYEMLTNSPLVYHVQSSELSRSKTCGLYPSVLDD